MRGEWFGSAFRYVMGLGGLECGLRFMLRGLRICGFRSELASGSRLACWEQQLGCLREGVRVEARGLTRLDQQTLQRLHVSASFGDERDLPSSIWMLGNSPTSSSKAVRNNFAGLGPASHAWPRQRAGQTRQQ